MVLSDTRVAETTRADSLVVQPWPRPRASDTPRSVETLEDKDWAPVVDCTKIFERTVLLLGKSRARALQLDSTCTFPRKGRLCCVGHRHHAKVHSWKVGPHPRVQAEAHAGFAPLSESRIGRKYGYLERGSITYPRMVPMLS